MVQTAPSVSETNGVQCEKPAEASVSYHDHEVDSRREVRAYPLEGGINVVLGLKDADGQVVVMVLTPQLSAAIRAALALVDLPGARLTGLPK